MALNRLPATPDTGDYGPNVSPQTLAEHRILIHINSVTESLEGKYGTGPAIHVSIHDIDTGETHYNKLWMHTIAVEQFYGFVGSTFGVRVFPHLNKARTATYFTFPELDETEAIAADDALPSNWWIAPVVKGGLPDPQASRRDPGADDWAAMPPEPAHNDTEPQSDDSWAVAPAKAMLAAGIPQATIAQSLNIPLISVAAIANLAPLT